LPWERSQARGCWFSCSNFVVLYAQRTYIYHNCSWGDLELNGDNATSF